MMRVIDRNIGTYRIIITREHFEYERFVFINQMKDYGLSYKYVWLTVPAIDFDNEEDMNLAIVSGIFS